MLVFFPKGSELCVGDLENASKGAQVVFTASAWASNLFTSCHIVSLFASIPCFAQKRNMANSSEIRGFLLRKSLFPARYRP